MEVTERRHSHRFEIQSPVLVRWREGDQVREALTVSEDVSAHGVYFILPQGIRNGTPVEVEMTLPNEITLAGPVRVRCLGHIRRSEAAEGSRAGMAASIEKYEFLPGDRSSRGPAPQDQGSEG